jgi:B9 domain-containing protein 1
VQCTGQIVSGEFGPVDYLYCRYTFHYGNDWTIQSGLDNGLSQTACKNLSQSEEQIIWNFPVDVSFNATNVFGWPRIAISVYGIDFLGRDVIRGYGSALVPMSSGQHLIEVDMFVPLASSYLNEAVAWIMGNPPEFFDSKFVCQSEGREVSRVRRSGKTTLSLNVVTKGTRLAPETCTCLCLNTQKLALTTLALTLHSYFSLL